MNAPLMAAKDALFEGKPLEEIYSMFKLQADHNFFWRSKPKKASI